MASNAAPHEFLTVRWRRRLNAQFVRAAHDVENIIIRLYEIMPELPAIYHAQLYLLANLTNPSRIKNFIEARYPEIPACLKLNHRKRHQPREGKQVTDKSFLRLGE